MEPLARKRKTSNNSILRPLAAEPRAKLQNWMLNRNKWSLERKCLTQEDCATWLPYFSDAKPDPYVELTVYKRSSYFSMKEDGEIELLPPSPMTQSSDYNKTTQSDKERQYLDIQRDLFDSASFQEYVRHWSDVHGLGPNEPILSALIQTRIEPFTKVDINGDGFITQEEYEAVTQKKDFDKVDLDNSGTITIDEYLKATKDADPLSGQGIHRDGMAAVSVLCISRENCKGAESELYDDHSGKHLIKSVSMNPGECLHFKDLDMFHNVTRVQPVDYTKTMHRSVLVLLARFQDDWWYGNMEKTYGTKGYNCVKGVGELETLFNLLDTDRSGEVDLEEFKWGMDQLVDRDDIDALFASFDQDKNGTLTKKELIEGFENKPIFAVHNHKDEEVHLW